MKTNKKNRLFKGLWKKTETEFQERVQEEPVETDPKTEETRGSIEEPSPSGETSEQTHETPERRQKEEKENSLDCFYHLYCRWCEYEREAPMEENFSQWMKEPARQELLGDENLCLYAERFRKQMIPTAEDRLQKIEEAETKARLREIEKTEQETETPQETETLSENEAPQEDIKLPPDMDAAPLLYLGPENHFALLCVLPPLGDGAPLNEEGLADALSREEITTGIDAELLQRVAKEQLYFQIFLIAAGTAAVPGKDGEIIEHIPRKEVLSFEEDESGRVDFRELHLFRNIQKGDLICEIIEPEKGTEGIDVKGNILKAPDGKKPAVPAGSHTEITSDGQRLIASIDGYISFQNGKFRVEKQLIINGNIDMSVGNQDFLGDIIVYGDVISGFTLKATGNILVKGFVEGATLIAGENIQITDGMNGSNCGELRAGGVIRSAFLENVKVYATGDVIATSMVSCEVRTHGSIHIEQIGVLIGGKITAGKSVTAKTIGSKAYRKTEFFLGMTPETRAEKEEKEKELGETQKTRTLLKKNIQFLQAAETLPKEKADVLDQLIEQEELYGQIEKELQQEVEALNGMISYQNCFVQSGTVYPPVKITIGSASSSIDTTSTNCRFYLSKEGEIVHGTV